MKLHLHLFLIALLTVTVSCRQENGRPGTVHPSPAVEITVGEKTGIELPIEHWIEKVEFVRLETRSDVLIGQISHLLFTDSLIIVADQGIAQAIFVFDRNGRFRNRIGGRGQGPGEYLYIEHLALAPGKDRIAIVDMSLKRIMYYELDGTYLHTENFPFWLFYFEYLASGNKAFNVSGLNDPEYGKYRNNELIVTGSRNDVLYGACNDYGSEDFNFWGTPNPLRKFGGEVYFNPSFTDTVFLVTDEGVEPKYLLTVENSIPFKEKRMTDELFQEYKDHRGYYLNGDFLKVQDYFILHIMNHPTDFVLYSHKTSKIYKVLDNNVTYNPFSYMERIYDIYLYKDNIVVCPETADELSRFKENLYGSVKDPEQYGPRRQHPLMDDADYLRFMESLYEAPDFKEDDNPVLFFYHLKTDL
ncbi:MAG: 6-bladed beta-propeller [Dysgonamonadaceae bacterium]|jgi:hypothetical protein|nr:6-bladed beta-propeller [Dysgonamonadaceae bacterium]